MSFDMSAKNEPNEFGLKELVFAKVKGYPPWPARVLETGNKCKVYFFGTGETGFVRNEDIYKFRENKVYFKKRFSMRKNYKAAFKEIEKFIMARNLRRFERIIRKQVHKIQYKKQPCPLTLAPKKPAGNDNITHKQKNGYSEKLALSLVTMSNAIGYKQMGHLLNTTNGKDVEFLSIGNKPLFMSIKVGSPSNSGKDPYYEDTSLKFEINNIRQHVYTYAECNKILTKHEELLKEYEGNFDNISAGQCVFLKQDSVLIHHVPKIRKVLAVIIPKNNIESVEGKLKTEKKLIEDIYSTLKIIELHDLPITKMFSGSLMVLEGMELLMASLKILLDEENMDGSKRAILAGEFSLLKMVQDIKSYVATEDESCLEVACYLLQQIQDKYWKSFRTMFKYPIVANLFISLREYKTNRNGGIEEQIRNEAVKLTSDLEDRVDYIIPATCLVEGSVRSFKECYRICTEQFQKGFSLSAMDFNFIAITSMNGFEISPEE